MTSTFKHWPAADLRATLFAVAILAILETVIFARWVAPSAVVAGCSAAIVMRYLQQTGHSRMAQVGAFLLSGLIAGSVGVIIFGR